MLALDVNVRDDSAISVVEHEETLLMFYGNAVIGAQFTTPQYKDQAALGGMALQQAIHKSIIFLTP